MTQKQDDGGVIIAENDPLVCGILRAVLQKAGQDVRVANDGLEAVLLAHQRKPRLVLLDIRMPRLSGLLACEAIRAKPGYADVPIIMLTGYSDQQMQNSAQRLGATEFITKPFQPRALLARLANYLNLAVPEDATADVILPARQHYISTAHEKVADAALRGGWIAADVVTCEPSTQALETACLSAGIPTKLVNKWFGYAEISPAAVFSDAKIGGIGTNGPNIPMLMR